MLMRHGLGFPSGLDGLLQHYLDISECQEGKTSLQDAECPQVCHALLRQEWATTGYCNSALVGRLGDSESWLQLRAHVAGVLPALPWSI